jgi:molecular chaperone DnaK (HSP70)
MMRNRKSIGVDFGTTNTVVAIAEPGEAVRAITFHDNGEQSDIYRSVRASNNWQRAASMLKPPRV